MGLDAVELVMAFEEEFGIAIPDSAAEKMQTPGHVIDYVIAERKKVAHLDAHTHLLATLDGMGFANVRPDTSFNELFGNQRVARWKELGNRLAPFSVPPDVPHGSGCVAIFLFLMGREPSDRTRRIPDSVGTVEKLAAHLIRPFSESEVAEKVRAIVIEQLGLDESVYGEDKRFIEDFGVG